MARGITIDLHDDYVQAWQEVAKASRDEIGHHLGVFTIGRAGQPFQAAFYESTKTLRNDHFYLEMMHLAAIAGEGETIAVKPGYLQPVVDTKRKLAIGRQAVLLLRDDDFDLGGWLPRVEKRVAQQRQADRSVAEAAIDPEDDIESPAKGAA